MSKVKAVACDRNSDFEEFFKKRYPHYDCFYVINDEVIFEICKDKQKWLADDDKLLSRL